MKKYNLSISLNLQLKRARKTIKRRKKIYRQNFSKTYVSFQEKVCQTQTYKFLQDSNYRINIESENDSCIIFEKFSFRNSYENTNNSLKEIFSKIYNRKFSKFEINFKKCNDIELSPLMVLIIILRDFYSFSETLSYRYDNKKLNRKKIVIIKSENNEVNKLLFACRLIPSEDIFFEGMKPLNSTEIIIGRKSSKNFSYNAKGPAIEKIKNQINICLKSINLELNPFGQNKFGKLIGEILGNAEDHSKINEWFALGIVMINEKDLNDEKVVMLNLVMMNLGNSIFDGFELTKELNKENYLRVEQLYKNVGGSLKNKFFGNFSKESLFTLYILQEGISRRKYLKPSAGHGTIPFINAFMELSENEEDGHISDLAIFSGNTMVRCLKKYEPFKEKMIDEEREIFKMSLNKEKNLEKLPDGDCLKNLPSNFPGTILSAKIYLNEKTLKSRLNNGN